MYIFLALLSAIILGIYEVLKKVSLKKSSVQEVLFFYCFCGFIISLIFISYAINMTFIDVIFVLIKSAIIVVDWWLVLKCMKKLDVGIVTSFSLVNTILTVFASSLFFNEQLSWRHFLSLIFISIGVILISFLDRKQTEAKERKNHYSYLLILILASFLGAISALFDKYLLTVRKVDSRGVLVWFLLFNTLIYGFVYFIKNKKIEWGKLKENYWMILTGLAIALADITYYLCISSDGAQLSIISILRKCSVIVATILASVFLKEKNLIKKLLILVIMIIGVALPIIFK